jgi:hypothetical protein
MMDIVRNNSGNAMPYAIAITLSLLIILCGVIEYARIMIISTGIRDVLQSAVIASVVANYDEAYSSLREGYSGGYTLSDSDWEEQIDYGDIYNRISNTLGLTQDGSYYVKRFDDGYIEYRLYGLNVEISNPPLASVDSSRNLTIESTIVAEIPTNFLNKTLPPVNLKIKMTASYTPKF